MNVSTGSDKWLASNGFGLLRRPQDPDSRLSEAARRLVKSLPPALQDDRYLTATLPEDSVAAAVVSAVKQREPVAFIGGSLNDGILHLDTLADDSGATPTETVAAALELLVNEMSMVAPQSTGETDWPVLQLWTRPDERMTAAAIADMGFERVRSLHQLRIALPSTIESVPTRSFDPDRDLAELVEVNNRSFAEHPDQGNQTETTVANLMNEPWFDPNGLRVLDDPDGSGAMAGFCWTKVHPVGNYHPTTGGNRATGNPLGEIYIIGLHPDVHGRGLGVPLVAAGLEWLAAAGTSEVLLYVESDNTPALRTYERLGFTINRTDAAWRRSGASTGSSFDTSPDDTEL